MASAHRHTPTKKDVPVLALSLHDDGNEHLVSFKQNEGDKPQLSMVGYSGGVISKHWYWGDLAIDLNGMSFPKSKYPILRDHDTNKIVAFTKKPSTDNNQLTVSEATFMKTEYADEFVKLSKDGFPFQASIRVNPTSIEFVDEGVETEVNGFTFKGPGTIFRKTQFIEVSVCVFGYDKETSSKAYSENGPAVQLSYEEIRKEPTPEKEKPMPKLEQFQKDDPDGYNKLVEDLTGKIKSEFSEQAKEKDQIISKLTDEIGNQQTEFSKKFAEYDKQMAAFKEKELRNEAHSILSAKLSESEIPERAHGKIKVSYDAFVKDDVLDVTAYTEAVDAEIASWAGMFTEEPARIIGGGNGTRQVPDKVQFSEEDATKKAKELLASLGHTIKED